jgi:hypothetical protein
MALGLFAGCEGNCYTEEETKDMVDCSLFQYNVAMSSIGAPIILFYFDEKAVFECVASNGEFGLQDGTNQAGQKIYEFYWFPGNNTTIFEQAFVDVILKIDERIIGYAVIEIYATAPSNMGFKARNLKSALFPKIEGEYQEVSQEQVTTIIEKVKNK